MFGVGCLVLPTDKFVHDKVFQSLSMTSEKWQPLADVPPSELPAWLAVKKTEGYTVVGAEQTVKSKGLADFQFPQKSIIVLGDERQGLSVDVLAVSRWSIAPHHCTALHCAIALG